MILPSRDPGLQPLTEIRREGAELLRGHIHVHSRPLADGAEGHSLRVVLMRALRDQVVVVMATVVIWEFPADIGASIIYRAASRCLIQKLTRRSVYAILPVSEHAAVAGDDFREPVGTENAIRENRAGISPSQ